MQTNPLRFQGTFNIALSQRNRVLPDHVNQALDELKSFQGVTIAGGADEDAFTSSSEITIGGSNEEKADRRLQLWLNANGVDFTYNGKHPL